MDSSYYTTEEAMKKLNKSRLTFLKEIENGLIPFELEPGRQRGKRFPKEAIDVLARRQQIKQERDEPNRLIFSFSSPADTWAEVQIGISLYGEDDIVPFEKLLEWQDVNNQMQKSLKDRGQVVAYSSLMPLEESIMLPLIQDKIRERDISNSSIRQWTDPQISVYVCSLTVKPSGNITKDRELGRFILKHTIKWALAVNRQFNIKNWYGIGATFEGQKLFEALGFSEIVSVHGGTRKGYLLKDVRSSARLINMLLKESERQNLQRSSSN